MKFDLEKHHRRSVRLQGYDYSQEGGYYITVCAKNRECLFGEICNGGRGAKYCAHTDGGKIAEQCWREIPEHYPFIVLDKFIIMPNHIHGMLFIQNNDNPVGVQNFEPLPINRFQKIIPGSIGAIIRGYKIGVTKWFRANTNIFAVWQRNYYEHIIRDEDNLNRVREYIINNPYNWKNDELFLE